MKNVVKILGVIALVAVIGFGFVSCEDEDTGGGGDGGPKLSWPDELAYTRPISNNMVTYKDGEKYGYWIQGSGNSAKRIGFRTKYDSGPSSSGWSSGIYSSESSFPSSFSYILVSVGSGSFGVTDDGGATTKTVTYSVSGSGATATLNITNNGGATYLPTGNYTKVIEE